MAHGRHSFPFGRGGGRGQGWRTFNLPFCENIPGKPPTKTWILPDPITGRYKIHIANIPINFNESMLRNLFRRADAEFQSLYLNTNQGKEGKPFNWGFVEYNSFKEASETIHFVNNNPHFGGILVAFAREKDPDNLFTPYFEDETMDFLDTPALNQNIPVNDVKPNLTQCTSPVADGGAGDASSVKPKNIIKTIRNEKALKDENKKAQLVANVPLDNILDPYNDEEELDFDIGFARRIQTIYSKIAASYNCQVCEVATSFRCGNCKAHYCSVVCQTKDRPKHSKMCDTMDSQSQSGSDHPIKKNYTPNGHQFEGQRKSEKQNGDTRHYNNKISVRPNNRDEDKTNDRGNSYNDRSFASQARNNYGEGKQSLYDERKNNFIQEKQSRNEPERKEESMNPDSEKSGFTYSQNKYGQKNSEPQFYRKTPYSSDTPQENVSQKSTKLSTGLQLIIKEQEFLSRITAQKSQTLNSSTSGSTQTPKVAGDVQCNTYASSAIPLAPGAEEQIQIMVLEAPGVFYAQLLRLRPEIVSLQSELDAMTEFPSYSLPTLGGLCMAVFDNAWGRCTVTSLEPITVFYMDYGNSETLTVDKLFSLPASLAAKPPLAIKMKLVEGTSAQYMNQVQGTLTVKVLYKEGDHWIVRVAEEPEPPQLNRLLLQNLPGQPVAPPSFPKRLPGDHFTKVQVTHKEHELLFVTPVASISKLQELTKSLQAEAATTLSLPVSSSATKCLARSRTTNLWGRGSIVSKNPLCVKFVDVGTTEGCDESELKELPPHLTSITPYVIGIIPMEGSIEDLYAKNTFCVKPLHKAENGHWLVEVLLVATSSRSQPVMASPAAPPIQALTQQLSLMPNQKLVTSPVQAISSIQQPSLPSNRQPLSARFSAPVSAPTQPLCSTVSVPIQQPFSARFSAPVPALVQQTNSVPIQQPFPAPILPLNQPRFSIPVLTQSLDSAPIQQPLSACPQQLSSEPIQSQIPQLVQSPLTAPMESHSEPIQQPYQIPVHSTISTPVPSPIQQLYSTPIQQPFSAPPVQSTVPVQSPVSAMSERQVSTLIQQPSLATIQRTIPEKYSGGDSIEEPILAPVQEPISAPITVPTSVISKQGRVEEFPEFLKRDQFSIVIILYTDPAMREGDTYFIANTNIFTTLTEMSQHFASVSRDVLLSPSMRDLGVSRFDGYWYRVRVVGLSPLQVHYIDFGNTENIHPSELKVCPSTYKDIPPLAHKAKLAAGTDKKYCNLAFKSQIKVKPVSSLPDGTIILQVEGENYGDSGPISLIPTQTSQHTPAIPAQPVYANVSNHFVDQLKVGYEVEFILSQVEMAAKVALGTALSHQYFPEGQRMLIEEHFNTILSSQTLDPNFVPKVGELVGYKEPDTTAWQRGEVLEVSGQKWISRVDLGGLIPYTDCKTLPAQYTHLQHMGAVLKPTPPVNPRLFTALQEDTAVVKVVEVTETGFLVQCQLQGWTFTAELEAWRYNALAWPLPLVSGMQVSPVRMIDSATFLVVPADDHRTKQTIQIECFKVVSQKLQAPPKVGDFVVSHLIPADIFYRARVLKIDSSRNLYTLFNIDLGNEFESHIDSLLMMPDLLRKVPCRCLTAFLGGVKKVEPADLPEEAIAYISNTLEEGNSLNVELDAEFGFVKLINRRGDVINQKLQEILTRPIVPDLNGKFTQICLPPTKLSFNEEVQLVVVQTEPLFVQEVNRMIKFIEEVHVPLQAYGESTTDLYNPCNGELCVAKFGADGWYRAVCIQETNTGVNSVLFIDYGNFANIPTCEIRKIPDNFVNFPAAGIKCKIIGLPDETSPELRVRLEQILPANTIISGTFQSEKDGVYQVDLPKILSDLKLEKLVL